MHRVFFTLALLLSSANGSSAQETYQLVEKFEPGTLSRVEQKTELTGKLAVPADKEAKETKPQIVSLSGSGKVVYDERQLPSDDAETRKVLRQYRSFEVRRVVGAREQGTDLRKAVYRQVVLRSAKGKSPFSPDGPLLWGEIDAIRTDVFSPALVPALLPAKAVAVNDTWPLDADGVTELTDMEKVTAGGFTLKFLGVVTINGHKQARLSLSGSARGVDDNGPCKHTLDGTAYFDLDGNRLSYLSLKGTHDLLDGAGQTVGTIEGRFTLNRTAVAEVTELSDAALKDLELKPTPENSALLYDNPQLGVRFLYPRRWRIGAVQGKQVTLDGPNGAGILITIEAAKSLPSVADFLRESTAFLQKSSKDVSVTRKPERIVEKPAVDRFSLTASMKDEKVRMEYAVLTNADGSGVTFAGRLPDADAEALGKDVEKVLKSLAAEKK
ncbi:hypothetical protein [Limnoglobus roseus]|uniref:Uncharacterized protein n=1 Tax=Limnoglobus roseus TaxID=2598579 RepID=A0A5C1AFS8_9BACT|nr:hypothetical protein [Limnoglobus roseus]QEL16592.1 hypothetical protein PX52LOC_03552 [Limnoglobus roseus]